MKLLLLPPLLVVGLDAVGSQVCDGCIDTSDDPPQECMQTGSCFVFTTAQVTAWSGECSPTNAGCASMPCSPTISVRSASESADGVLVSGGIGNVTFGPLRTPAGTSVEVYRSTVVVKCGHSSDYFFWVTTLCSETPQIDYVAGSFVCSACAPH